MKNSAPVSTMRDDARLLNAFVDIARQLAKRAIWHGERCTWFGPDVEKQEGEGQQAQWVTVHRTVDQSLYGGLSGIAIFLSTMASRINSSDMTRTAIAAMNQAQHLVSRHDNRLGHGFYSGFPGYLWAVERTAEITGNPSLLCNSSRQKLLDVVGTAPSSFDLVDGLAGSISALLLMHQPSDDQRLLDRCCDLADRLMAMAHTVADCGKAWQCHEQLPGAPDLCGLAHGASSSALVLFELANRCACVSGKGLSDKAEIYRACALDAVLYERQWFDRTTNGWPDLRSNLESSLSDAESINYPCYWCHGSAGIGLCRLRAYELTGDINLLAEATAALTQNRQAAKSLVDRMEQDSSAVDDNISVCHGAGSILDLLLYSYRLLRNDDDLELAHRIVQGELCRLENTGKFNCGLIGAGESPGFMLGTAGFGMILLRMLSPESYMPVGLPSTLARG